MLVSAFCTEVSRQKAQEINKQLEERANSLEMTAQEAAEGNI